MKILLLVSTLFSQIASANVPVDPNVLNEQMVKLFQNLHKDALSSAQKWQTEAARLEAEVDTELTKAIEGMINDLTNSANLEFESMQPYFFELQNTMSKGGETGYNAWKKLNVPELKVTEPEIRKYLKTEKVEFKASEELFGVSHAFENSGEYRMYAEGARKIQRWYEYMATQFKTIAEEGMQSSQLAQDAFKAFRVMKSIDWAYFAEGEHNWVNGLRKNGLPFLKDIANGTELSKAFFSFLKFAPEHLLSIEAIVLDNSFENQTADERLRLLLEKNPYDILPSLINQTSRNQFIQSILNEDELKKYKGNEDQVWKNASEYNPMFKFTYEQATSRFLSYIEYQLSPRVIIENQIQQIQNTMPIENPSQNMGTLQWDHQND